MTATLSSPFESVITPVDTGFSYGQLVGGATRFTAEVPPVVTVAGLLALVIVVLLLGVAFRLLWMGGDLVLATGEEPPPGARNVHGYPSFSLRGLRRSHKLADLHGNPARLTARGSLRRRDIRIRIRVDGKGWTKEPVWLPRGGTRENVAGASIQHRRPSRVKRSRWRWRKAPDDSGT